MHKKSKFQKYFSNNAINLDIEIDITPHDIYIAFDILTISKFCNIQYTKYIYNIYNRHKKKYKLYSSTCCFCAELHFCHISIYLPNKFHRMLCDPVTGFL